MKTDCCNSEHIHLTEVNAICINQDCENYLGYTKARHNSGKWKNTFAAAFITFLLLFAYEDFSKENTEELLPASLFLRHQDRLTIDEVTNELLKQEIISRHEVLAQVKIESANLSSALFKRTNNMFGMRYPFKRKTTASGIYIPSMDTIIYGNTEQLRKYGKTKNYAVYKTWQDCVADYKLWQDRYFNLSARYLEFIGKIYAEDTLYVSKIKHVSSTNKLHPVH